MGLQQEIIDVIDDFTEEENESLQVQALRTRVNRCKCSYCGSELILRRISYGNAEEGRLDLFCPSCNRIEYGVEPEIYQIAKYYIDEIGFDYYAELDESIRKTRMNMAKVCEMMQWCCKNLGLLNQDGFTTEVQMEAMRTGQDLLLRESYLKTYVE